MRVFVTGATGFVGTAVVKDLLDAGHQVLGLARSEASAQALAATGAQVHRGSLEDVDSLRRGAADSDGVIHTGFIHDFSNMAASAQVDQRAIEVIGATLAGSQRPFVVTSAIGLLGRGGLGTEDDAANANSPGGYRVPSEVTALGLASQGVRASVVRLPPSVHGEDDHGFVPALIRIARDKGLSAYVGEGGSRWSAVHKIDAAQVYRLALEKGAAGTVFHAIGDEGVPTRDIARVIGRHLGVPVASKPPEETASHFGWLGKFFALDAAASSTRTQERLGWSPRQPGLLADLEQGHYFKV